jgi:hypothetical protein
LIVPAGEGSPFAVRAHVAESAPADTEGTIWCPELVPLPGESAEAYRGRLEGPACRTAAWRVVLAAQEAPVGVVVRDDLRSSPHFEVLLGYLRDLMS